MKVVIYGVGGKSGEALAKLRSKYPDDMIAGFTQTKKDVRLREKHGKPVYDRDEISELAPKWGG